MRHTRTVTLELLRHGPPHNQLLSPLTQYMALCGNHPSSTISVPLEHNQFLFRQRALRYKDSQASRQYQLEDIAQIMAKVLGEVPGLIAELAECPGHEMSLTHLRLILSASELALLPFELANAPNGFPGAGQPLTLQAQAPLCMTREVRRVSNTQYSWPTKPRILFLAASPEGADIPLEAHLLALRKVIDPWVEPADHVDQHKRRPSESLDYQLKDRLSQNLVVLPQASATKIQMVCDAAATDGKGEFTHVHILAHGVEVPDSEEKRYGLALHSDQDPSKRDVVDAARLATLLRNHRSREENDVSGPAVVTLASCEAGDGGSVVGAGASVAHALHEGGIPLVVAAQFPLSFPASVLMASVLYEGLLWGFDPRILLNELRGQLKTLVPGTHDWASLVAYASLPASLDTQLSNVRFSQAWRCINTALRYMDRVTAPMTTKSELPAGTAAAPAPDSGPARQDAWGRARDKIDDGKQRLNGLLRDPSGMQPAEISRIHGLLAATEKRDAELLYRAGLEQNRSAEDIKAQTRADPGAMNTDPAVAGGDVTSKEVLFVPYQIKAETIWGGSAAVKPGRRRRLPIGAKAMEQMRQALERSLDEYSKAFRVDRESNWALTQALCVAAVLKTMARDTNAAPASRPSPPVSRDEWIVARFLAEDDLNHRDRKRVAWAHASLIELYLLCQITPRGDDLPVEATADSQVEVHAEALVKLLGRDNFEVYSARRQINRYCNWFNEISPAFDRIAANAKLAVSILPYNSDFA
jgi:hypothetical protein